MPLSLSLSLCLSLSVSLSLSVCLSLSLCVFLSVSLPLSLSLCLSLCHYVSLSLPMPLSLCLYVSLSLKHMQVHTSTHTCKLKLQTTSGEKNGSQTFCKHTHTLHHSLSLPPPHTNTHTDTAQHFLNRRSIYKRVHGRCAIFSRDSL